MAVLIVIVKNVPVFCRPFFFCVAFPSVSVVLRTILEDPTSTTGEQKVCNSGRNGSVLLIMICHKNSARRKKMTASTASSLFLKNDCANSRG